MNKYSGIRGNLRPEEIPFLTQNNLKYKVRPHNSLCTNDFIIVLIYLLTYVYFCVRCRLEIPCHRDVIIIIHFEKVKVNL